jgi:hypothetical protein
MAPSGSASPFTALPMVAEVGQARARHTKAKAQRGTDGRRRGGGGALEEAPGTRAARAHEGGSG